jgi:hypothetical protein
MFTEQNPAKTEWHTANMVNTKGKPKPRLLHATFKLVVREMALCRRFIAAQPLRKLA